MTREEAHRILSNGLVNAPSEHEWCMAFEIAIQALSQEPTEKAMTVDEMECEYEKSKALFHKIVECDDAISRDAFITRYREWMKSEYGKIPDDDALAIRVIKSLPPVTQKSGKWIERQNIARTSIATAIEFRWTYECSKCGHEVRHKTRFCASCGAKMVEPQESEDKG